MLMEIKIARKIIPLPGVYPRKMKTYIYTNTCMLMFLAALLIIALNWKQFTGPSSGDWMNQMCIFTQ